MEDVVEVFLNQDDEISEFFSLSRPINDKSDVTFWPSDVTLSEHAKMALFVAQKTLYLRTKFLCYIKKFINDSL